MNKQLFTFPLIYLTCSCLMAQQYDLSVGLKETRFEFKIEPGETVTLDLKGVDVEDQFWVYIDGDRPGDIFSFATLPARAELLSADLLTGVGQGFPPQVRIGSNAQQSALLSLIVRKKGRLGTQKMGPILSSSSTDLDFLMSSLFRFEECFERTGTRLVAEDRVLTSGRRAAQTGTFSNGRELIDIETGIMLTTGFTYEAGGPNSVVPASGSFPGAVPIIDADIQDLVGPGVPYFDAAILEFSFTPTTDSISFDYVFFSEEYCGAINSQFGNDAFAFILDGPEGRRNIARLPNGDVISPFTLNHVKTPDLFLDNTPPGSVDDCAGGTIPPDRLAGINYNGFSRRLTAKAKVTPCETYTLKFLVADAGDAQLDSGVFIEAGALTTALLLEPGATAADGMSSLIFEEGCDTAFVTFTRLFDTPADLQLPLAVNYDVITSGGTLNYGTGGVDFEQPTGPVEIPVGETSVTIPFPILADGDATEGEEAFIIDYRGLCDCSDARDTFLIRDAELLVISLDAPAQACAGDEITVTATVTGGDGNYQLIWPDGPDGLLRQFDLPGRDTSIEVQVTDGCGEMSKARVNVSPFASSAELTSGRYSLCNRTSVAVPLRLGGDGPFAVVIREVLSGVSGDRSLTVSNDTTFLVAEPGSIEVIQIQDVNGCDITPDDGPALIVESTIESMTAFTHPSCTGDANGTITIDNSVTPAELLDYSWSDGANEGAFRDNLPAGSYSVTVSVGSDPVCFAVENFNLIDPDPILESRQTVSGQTCDEDGVISLEYLGGTGALSYAWSNGRTRPDLIGLEAGDYGLTVTDDNDCFTTQTYTITDLRSMPVSTISSVGLELTCSNPTATLSAPAAAPNTIYIWRNSLGDTLGIADQFVASETGTYALIARDTINGCQGISTVVVTESGTKLSIGLPEVYALTCANPSATLVPGLAPSSDISLAWSFNGMPVGTSDSLSGITTAGTYEVTATRASDGCVATETTTVVDRTGPPNVMALAALVTRNCRNPETDLTSLGAGNFAYQWSTETGSIVGPTTDSTTVVGSAGSYTLEITDTTTACLTELTFTVVDDGAKLTPVAGADVDFDCAAAGNTLVGGASEDLPGSTFRWVDLSRMELSTTETVRITAPGDYVLEATHPISGCNSFDTLTVADAGPDSIAFDLTLSPCPEVGAELSVLSVFGGAGPYDFSASSGFPSPMGDGLSGLRAGTNELLVTDALGCELVDTIIVFSDEPFAGNAPDITLRFGEVAELGVATNRDELALQYQWSNLPDTAACVLCTNPSLRPLESFIARVDLRDPVGCPLSVNQRVFVQERDFIYMPTAFSPADGNGVNDVYAVFGDAEFVSAVRQFTIYNRWGHQVFRDADFAVNDLTRGWSGETEDGKPYPSGAYVFALEVVLYDGSAQTLKGSFTLLR